MSFNASNYVVNTSAPSAPRLNVNLATDPAEVVSSACDEYVSAATKYASSIMEIVGNREYVSERLAKDLCVSVGVMTDGGIDYANNQIALHVKADELFGQAKGTRALSNVANVTAIANNFSSLYEIYYMENGSSVLTSDYEAAVQYDSKAVQVINEHSDNYFILANPNAVGSARVYETVAGVDSAYTVSYGAQYPESAAASDVVVTDAWLMKDSDNVVVEYAPYGEGNLANAEFVSVVNPPNSEESSENEESSESEEPVTP